MRFWELKTEITEEDLDKFNYPNRKLGVIIHIEDINQSILLHQRGTATAIAIRTSGNSSARKGINS